MLLVDEKLSIGGRDGKLAMGLLLVVVVLLLLLMLLMGAVDWTKSNTSQITSNYNNIIIIISNILALFILSAFHLNLL